MRKLLTLAVATSVAIGCAAGPKPALHQAVAKGDMTLVRKLLREGASPNLVDDQRLTPLYEAIIHERFDIAEELVKSGADVNWRSTAKQFTPLALAVNRGRSRSGEVVARSRGTGKLYRASDDVGRGWAIAPRRS